MNRPIADDAVSLAEERVATAMAWVRVAMVPFVWLPLVRWRRMQRPAVALAAAVSATVEAAWVFRRVRAVGSIQDPVLVWGDAAFASALNVLGSRAVPAVDRNVIMTELVPFSLASAGVVGFGAGATGRGATAVAGLCGSWIAAAGKVRNLKLASDLMGFGLWYGTTILAGRELREMARRTMMAQHDAARRQGELAEQERIADVARERDITHREIHEHLLPIVDVVASGRPLTERLVRLATREADRARRLIMDGRVESRPGLQTLVADARDNYLDAGLRLTCVLRVLEEPPADVAEALAGAAREALANVVKHAVSRDEVTLYVESSESGVEIVVRDHGVGFNADSVVAGGGFDRTFAAVRRRGGEVVITSTPGAGTKVSIRWRPS